MSNLTQYQLEVIDLYGLIVSDTIEDDADGVIAVCEVSHPTGSHDVYVYEDGSIYVEEGDGLDGYDMIPLSDSFLACLFRK